MTTPNKEAAKEVYTPDHATRLVSAAEAVPNSPTDGVDCSGFNVLSLSRVLKTATDAQFTLWFFDNKDWVAVEDTTTLPIADYDPTETGFLQQYNIAGVFRYKTQITALTGGNVQVTENLSV